MTTHQGDGLCSCLDCGYRIGTVAGLAEQFRTGTATYRPDQGYHSEGSRSKVATW